MLKNRAQVYSGAPSGWHVILAILEVVQVNTSWVIEQPWHTSALKERTRLWLQQC